MALQWTDYDSVPYLLYNMTDIENVNIRQLLTAIKHFTESLIPP